MLLSSSGVARIFLGGGRSMADSEVI